MAGRIRDEDIAVVRERSAIEDVVGQHLQLRSAGGGSLKGLCPFHEERTPSFTVSPQRGYYHCFGCGEGGDVISFVQRIEHLSFVEAVESLARGAGIELRYEQGGAAPGRQAGQRQRLLDAHAAAAEFFREQLGSPEAALGRRFLEERGFDEAVSTPFGVGYAPKSWDALTAHLRGRGFSGEELLSGGLVSSGQRGPIDRFRGRLVWPIRDIKGDVIGFGARRLHDDDNGPKYLNTPDSPLYKKSQVLYGIDLAKAEIARRMQAVVVEGYTDVMACHLAGVRTAVATCGTAFGSDHVAMLRRLLMDQDEFRGRVIFTFDGDEAGQNAAVKAFADDQRFVAQTFVAVEAAGLDPCDLRIQKGDAAVRDLVASHQPLFAFAIQAVIRRYDLNFAEGRIGALDAAAPVVARIKDVALRDEYGRRLAGWVGVPEADVVSRVRTLAASPGRRSAASAPAASAGGPASLVEREAVKLAVQRPALAGPVFDALAGEVFVIPEYAAVRAAVQACGGAVAGGSGGEPWVRRLVEAGIDDSVRRTVTELAVEPLRADDDDHPRYAAAILARVEEIAINRRIHELDGRLRRINPEEQTEEYNRAFGELIALQQHARTLREKGLGTL